MKDIELQTEAFKRYIQECDELSITPDYASAFNAAWNARAAVEADRAQRVPDTLCDDDLSDLAHSANQEALSFGLSHDVFLRYFKEVRRRSLASTPAQPAQPVERKPLGYVPISAIEDVALDGYLPVYKDHGIRE